MLTELPVALRRSILPNDSLPKFFTRPRRPLAVGALGSANSLKYCGLAPDRRDLRLKSPDCSAAIRVKILNVEPACILSWVAAFCWRFW